ncbi:MAG: hypothetical protein NW203_01670 [Hyphomonadaceae bacterium]|nr:hypothetical protein [Hyphomonadaceae bacterium]
MQRTLLAAAAFAGALSLTACGAGQAEKAGEELDSAYEESTQGAIKLGDGPMEEAGEAIDQAAEQASDSAADSAAPPPS